VASPSRPRRSAAAARRLRQAHSPKPTATLELPEQLATIAAQFQPRGALAADWRRVWPATVDILTRSTVRGEATFRKHLTHVGYFLAWASRQGLPMSASTVAREHVDEYCRIGMAASTEKSRADRRARLRWLADQLNPAQAPDRGVSVARPAVKPPYTDSQIGVICRVAETQPTDVQRRNLSACVGLGAGAGLDSADLRHLRVGDITDHGTDGLLVNVPGPNARTVPVLEAFELLVRDGLGSRPAESLMLGRKEGRRNLAARVIGDAVVLGDCPRIEQSRLRATWLAQLMQHQVPLAVILRAAGLRSARTLTDLLPHLDPDSGDGQQMLRGRGWAA
jgi:hypothetical protein